VGGGADFRPRAAADHHGARAAATVVAGAFGTEARLCRPCGIGLAELALAVGADGLPQRAGRFDLAARAR